MSQVDAAFFGFGPQCSVQGHPSDPHGFLSLIRHVVLREKWPPLLSNQQVSANLRDFSAHID
jgi:hypothetical protein